MTDRMDSGICHFHIIHNAFQKEYSRYNLISRWKLWGIFIFYFIFFRICAQNKDRLIWQPPHFLLNSVWERKTVAEESKSTGDSKTILYCFALVCFVLRAGYDYSPGLLSCVEVFWCFCCGVYSLRARVLSGQWEYLFLQEWLTMTLETWFNMAFFWAAVSI